MDELSRRQYLDAMGISVWQRRSVAGEVMAEDVVAIEPTEDGVSLPVDQGQTQVQRSNSQVEEMDWPLLRESVHGCNRCELRAGCTQTVFGVGNTEASLLVIGEAPGADEDRQGEPFVGRAGQLLNAMLLAMGFKREAVFIANIVKCRPPNNRDPKPEEALSCQPYLQRQIDLIQPDAILAVGRIAAQNLLKTEITVGKLRGRVHPFGERRIPLVVTYHPAYLLRSPEQKGKSWQDLQLALSVLRGDTP
jgi:DNA polymerase